MFATVFSQQGDTPIVKSVRLFEVGGCVRDRLLGIPSKDIDFAVEVDLRGARDAGKGYGDMREWLEVNGFEIFVETPAFFTIRAHFPRSNDARWLSYGRVTADFVLCRVDGPYSDGRRPDWVKAGTIWDDLRRRDFTMNALAVPFGGGDIMDPHGGVRDINLKRICCVGTPNERLREDALRALRALRFSVTKDMILDSHLWNALCSTWLPPLLAPVSVERKREELLKAFRHDPLKTMRLLTRLPRSMQEATFTDGLWLRPTLEG